MLRTLQRFRVFGGRVASVKTRATFAAGIDGLRPRPGSSSKPSSPRSAKRVDHSETRFAVVFSRAAATVTLTPSSRSRTMLARSRSRTVLVVARDRRRSSSMTVRSACKRLIGRAIRVMLPANQSSRRY